MIKGHTAEFIEEMRQKLLEERKTLTGELETLGRKEDGEYQADYPDYGRDEESNATESADWQALAATTQVNEARLREIDAALTRIAAGTYGLADTGEVIPPERLRANPAATTLIKPK